MKRRISKVTTMVAALGVCMIAATRLWNHASAEAQAKPLSARSSAPTPQASLNAEQRQLLADPRVIAWRGQERFRNEARRFFANAKNLSPIQRDQQASALHEQIERRERMAELSAGEALVLEVGLIKATTSDETEQKEMAMAVAERYRLRSEQRERAWALRPTPQFDTYKQRELQVVHEVAALTQIPDGLSRDEYLRQRLQHEREQIFVTHE